MKKKFLALALTAVMALSLAACGGDTQTSGDTSTDDTSRCSTRRWMPPQSASRPL